MQLLENLISFKFSILPRYHIVNKTSLKLEFLNFRSWSAMFLRTLQSAIIKRLNVDSPKIL